MRWQGAGRWRVVGAVLTLLVGSSVIAKPDSIPETGLCSKYGPRFECGEWAPASGACVTGACGDLHVPQKHLETSGSHHRLAACQTMLSALPHAYLA